MRRRRDPLDIEEPAEADRRPDPEYETTDAALYCVGAYPEQFRKPAEAVGAGGRSSHMRHQRNGAGGVISGQVWASARREVVRKLPFH